MCFLDPALPMLQIFQKIRCTVDRMLPETRLLTQRSCGSVVELEGVGLGKGCPLPVALIFLLAMVHSDF